MSDFFTTGPDYGRLYAEPEASQYRELVLRLNESLCEGLDLPINLIEDQRHITRGEN